MKVWMPMKANPIFWHIEAYAYVWSQYSHTAGMLRSRWEYSHAAGILRSRWEYSHTAGTLRSRWEYSHAAGIFTRTPLMHRIAATPAPTAPTPPLRVRAACVLARLPRFRAFSCPPRSICASRGRFTSLRPRVRRHSQRPLAPGLGLISARRGG